MIFDTHAHYDDRAFDGDRENMPAFLAAHGVDRVINVSADPESLRTTPALTEKWPFCYGALGLHPDHVGWLTEERLAAIGDALAKPKIVAVGEIGLDYHWNVEPKDIQEKWFRAQLNLAREHDVPFIVHSREAAADTLRILSEENAGKIGGVLHCYSYSLEHARIYSDMGLYFGIGGTVTYRNAKKVQQVVREMPLSCLLLETDCPYLAPEPVRGTRNSSANLSFVAARIAELKDTTPEEVIRQTAENACRLFHIPEA